MAYLWYYEREVRFTDNQFLQGGRGDSSAPKFFKQF